MKEDKLKDRETEVLELLSLRSAIICEIDKAAKAENYQALNTWIKELNLNWEKLARALGVLNNPVGLNAPPKH